MAVATPTILVIGAGIGGVAAAARLARHGYQVTVVEKNESPGGRCSKLEKDDHRFVSGPTLFLMPEIYAQTFTDLGEHLEDYLDLRRVDPTYQVHFRDGSTLSLTSDLQAMQTQLESFDPGSFEAFLRYLNEGSRHYRLGMAHLVKRNFYSLREYCHPRNLFLLFRLKGLISHYSNIGTYFRDSRLKAAFTFQDMYLGMSPFEASAIYSLLQYTEFAAGVWYPLGGMYSVVKALVSIAQKWGVQFKYDAPVVQIDIDGRHTTGVSLADGRQLRADIVIANADLPYVYRYLLPDGETAERLNKKRYSCSALMFCWGISKQIPQLGPHHLFVSRDYRQSFDRISKDHSLSTDPSFYLHAPRSIDPSAAPEGQDTLMVIVPIGHINEAAPQDWEIIQKQTRQTVLQRLYEIGITDLDQTIKFEMSFLPTDWEKRFNLTKGATHGLQHNVRQMAYLRPKNRHPKYHNLYFVGASTHPGTGLPTVLISARLTSERILEDAKVRMKLPSIIPAPVMTQ